MSQISHKWSSIFVWFWAHNRFELDDGFRTFKWVNGRRLNKSKDSGDWIEVGFLLSNMLIIPGFLKLFKFRLLD